MLLNEQRRSPRRYVYTIPYTDIGRTITIQCAIPVKGCELTHPESTYRCYVLTMHEVCEVSIRQEQSAKYAPFPLCRDSYSESSANIRIMFERTKVLSKKSSLRDKIHQNLPSLRDFSVFNHAMRNFYCTFAPVLEKATNKTEE